jgi:hypothetical protein
MIKLATVSPCYNEEEVLHHSVERLTALYNHADFRLMSCRALDMRPLYHVAEIL